MSKYARGRKAFGFCDRSGFRYPLEDLVYEYRNGVRTGLRVGRDIVDPDHPQNFIGKVKTDDPQSLYDPRPDVRTEGLFGFTPVGNPANFLTISTGFVTVTGNIFDPASFDQTDLTFDDATTTFDEDDPI